MRISFGIKTNLRNETKTLITILSILEQKIPESDYEIMIAGRTDFKRLALLGVENLRLLPDEVSADNGRLSTMMNSLAANARYENICLMDDDFILLDGWYDTLKTWINKINSFDILSFPIKNTDGSRFLDHCACKPGIGNLPYYLRDGEANQYVFVVGGFALFKKRVWEQVKWDEARGFYQEEDIDWSIRVKAAGFEIKHCPIAYVVHNDWRYYQNGYKLIILEKPEGRLSILKNNFHYVDNCSLNARDFFVYALYKFYCKLKMAIEMLLKLWVPYNIWLDRLRRRAFHVGLKETLPVDPSSRILDISTGSSFYIYEWRVAGFWNMVGFGITESAVTKLKAHYPKINFDFYDIRKEHHDFKLLSFDYISAFDVFSYIADDSQYSTAIKNIYSLLKPDGWFIWSDNFLQQGRDLIEHHQVSRTLEKASSVLKEAGFEIVSRRPMFWLMSAPVDSKNPFLKKWWKIFDRLLRIHPAVGSVAGALLFPFEMLLVRLLHESPTAEIMVCRKNRSA